VTACIAGLTTLLRLSQRGWRKVEPVEIPLEPSVLVGLIEVHREDHEYTADDMAKMVGLLVDEYRITYGDAEPPTHGLRLIRT
jgi:hypothetical protein